MNNILNHNNPIITNNNANNTVLITGSHGFTGSYLREALLSRGYQVWGMTNDNPSDWEVCADLTDPLALRQVVAKIRPDYVIHLAGISNVIHNNHDALYQINLHGTLNLLAAIQQEAIPVKKIILASSAYVYGNQQNIQLITENTLPKPSNHYAMSKLSMEYMGLGLYEKLPIVIARPFNYTGVAQQEYVLIPKIIRHFAQKAPEIHLGNLHVYREFNDVRMAVHAYAELLTQAEPGTTVNICTGKSFCLHDILNLSKQISGHYLEVIINPAFVRENEAQVLSGDPAKLQSLIPNLPAYTLEDTLRWMFEAFKK